MKAWKKFRPKRESNPWPLRHRCSALPTELSSHLGAGHKVSSYYTRRLWQMNIWISHIWTAEKDIKTSWSSQLCTQLKQLRNLRETIMFCVILYHDVLNLVFFCSFSYKKTKINTFFFELSVRAKGFVVPTSWHRAKRPIAQPTSNKETARILGNFMYNGLGKGSYVILWIYDSPRIWLSLSAFE